jgi:hypothetical protein
VSLERLREPATDARAAASTLAWQIGQRSMGVPWRQNFDTVLV